MRHISVVLLTAIILPLIALMVFLMIPADIQAATNTTVIEVNISTVAQITVAPKWLSWYQVAPGGNGSIQTVTVENTGSEAFLNGIYVEVDSYTNKTTNPTVGSAAHNYMAGSFLVIANSTDWPNDRFWFVNQMSWNETYYPNPASPTAGAISWGWYNNASQRWLWELVPNASGGQCVQGDDQGVGLKVQPTVDSASLSGATSANYISNSSEWSLWGLSNGPLADYCILASVDCTHLMIYRYDKNSSLPTSTNCTYIDSSTFSASESVTFYLKPHVGKGTVAGTATNSTVTFTAD